MTETEITEAMQKLMQEALRLRAKRGKTQAERVRHIAIDREYADLAEQRWKLQRGEKK